MMDEEYLVLEKENDKLTEVAQRAKGTSDKLERIVYGPGAGSAAAKGGGTQGKKTRKRRAAVTNGRMMD